jgi:large subunit ribosomal protein L6
MFKNLMYGSSLGYTVKLKMVGIGYKIEIKQIENQLLLELKLGFSHTIKIKLPKTFKCKRFHEKSNLFIFSFESSQYLKNVVSLIRNLRFPEPYKGKGLRYENEIIRRKEGKKNNL